MKRKIKEFASIMKIYVSLGSALCKINLTMFDKRISFSKVSSLCMPLSLGVTFHRLFISVQIHCWLQVFGILCLISLLAGSVCNLEISVWQIYLSSDKIQYIDLYLCFMDIEKNYWSLFSIFEWLGHSILVLRLSSNVWTNAKYLCVYF